MVQSEPIAEAGNLPTPEPVAPAPEKKMNITDLESKSRDDLLDMARQMGVSGFTGLKKQDLIMRLLQATY